MSTREHEGEIHQDLSSANTPLLRGWKAGNQIAVPTNSLGDTELRMDDRLARPCWERVNSGWIEARQWGTALFLLVIVWYKSQRKEWKVAWLKGIHQRLIVPSKRTSGKNRTAEKRNRLARVFKNTP